MSKIPLSLEEIAREKGKCNSRRDHLTITQEIIYYCVRPPLNCPYLTKTVYVEGTIMRGCSLMPHDARNL